ncbi:helix-turn-helix transcriptional regulator [Mycobacteroides abscessus]|uniref:helix-turn-helix transcriptional regulator n=1 Tax=Mycobacteroides abscessus TaxID=36809 RepID=UPI000684C26A|nr:helix-turn-helix transcriptional regulator [Mycobacteroides abscessus]
MTQESEHDRWLSVLEKRIGKSVSSARGEAMVSQEELARRVGWSRNGVANLETGRASNPRVSVLLKIAAALDVPPMRLLFPNVLLPVEILPGVVMSGIDALGWFTGTGAARPGQPTSVLHSGDSVMQLAMRLVEVEQTLEIQRQNLAQHESGPSLLNMSSAMKRYEREQADHARRQIELLEAERKELVHMYTRLIKEADNA